MTGQDRAERPDARRTWLIVGAVLLIVVVAFFAWRGVSRLTGTGGAANKTLLLIGLNAGAKQIHDRAPIKIDAVTTLNDAVVADDTIIYTLSVAFDVPKADLAATQAKMQASDTANACADADIRRLIEAGGKMRWIYTDATGDKLQADLAKCT